MRNRPGLWLVLAALAVGACSSETTLEDDGTDGGRDQTEAATDTPDDLTDVADLPDEAEADAESEADVGEDVVADVPADEAGGGGCTAASAVATTAVTVADFAFEPPCIKVVAGTTVRWTNTGMALHTVTSDPGASVDFDSGALGIGGTFDFTFPAAATVDYHCTPHASAGMRGTVVVE